MTVYALRIHHVELGAEGIDPDVWLRGRYVCEAKNLMDKPGDARLTKEHLIKPVKRVHAATFYGDGDQARIVGAALCPAGVSLVVPFAVESALPIPVKRVAWATS